MAKAAGVAVVALLALQALPGLLRPPEAPPLEADVGLPQVAPAEPSPARAARAAGPVSDRGLPLPGESSRSSPPAAEARVIDGKPRDQSKQRYEKQGPAAVAPPPPPAPVAVPEPVVPIPTPPPPAPAPAPSPPPAPPSDGSEEFAPH